MMNSAALTFAASVVLLAATPHHGIAQTGFNGVIVFATHSENGKDGTLTQTTSGNKLLLQSSEASRASSGGIVFDGDAHTVTLMMAGQQQYMRMTEDQMKQRAAMMGGMSQPSSAAPSGTASIVNTGRTETIAGVTCEVYHGSGMGANGKPYDGEICVANGVGFAAGDFLRGLGRMGGANAVNSPLMSQVSDLLKGGKGVLKVTEIKNGQTTVLLVATKIDRTPPSSSVFEPPAGYTEMQIPQMPAGGMPGGMPAGGMKPPG